MASEELQPEAASSPAGALSSIPENESSTAAPAPSEKPKPAEEDNSPKASDVFMLARQQNFAVAAKLLDAYPKLWVARDEDGHTLLHWAALVGNNDFTKIALARGIDVDAVATNLQTPLMWAVLRGHTITARLLIDGKADLHKQDSLGATPLMIALQHRAYASVLLLMNRGGRQLLGDTDKNGCSSSHWAAYKGDLTALKLLDYFEADLHQLDNAKMTPLHRASFGSQSQVVEFLMERGADPLLKNADGSSCLDIAERQGDVHMTALFKKLLGSKKDVDPESGSSSGTASGGDDEVQPFCMGKKSEGEKQHKGMRGLMMTISKDKSMHKIFPCFWLVCVSLALFQYLMDLRAISYSTQPTASLLFELGVPLSLALFAYSALSDPGKVPPKARGHSGVEELTRQIDSAEENDVDISRLCTTTWVLKGLRAKYCTQTKAVVDEFDHYCIWLNCAIGRRNHRPFVCLAVCEGLTQLCHLYLCISLARELVPYDSFGSWLFKVSFAYPLLLFCAIIHALTCPWVFMLFLHQARLVAMNLTTNEMMNAGRYEHFWTMTPIAPGRVQREFRNPFNKGGIFKNCLDFWWYKGRADRGPVLPLKPCCEAHAHGHGHGHGISPEEGV